MTSETRWCDCCHAVLSWEEKVRHGFRCGWCAFVGAVAEIERNERHERAAAARRCPQRALERAIVASIRKLDAVEAA